MNDEQHNNWTTFWVILGLVLMGGPFLIPLFSEETLKTTNFKVGYAVVAIILILLAAFFCFPKMRVKTSSFLRRGVKSSICFFVWFCGAVVRFFRNLGKMFLKEILFDDQHDSQETSSETVEIDKEISTLKERVEELEKVLYKNERPLNSETSLLQPNFQTFLSFYKNERPLNSETSLKNWDIAEAGDRRTLTINGVEFAFRYCPPGEFTMGSPENEEGREYSDQCQHIVTISEGFWICEVPTTQEQWDAVGCEKAKECYFKGVKRPVENVTWFETCAFVKKLNRLGVVPAGWYFDLPSEEQWEYACRAGTTGLTYGISFNDCAWYKDNSRKQTHDVGGKQHNKWGIFDMLGNVWEWTRSTELTTVVSRGGSWNFPTFYCRPATRGRFVASNRTADTGFRLSLAHQSVVFSW